MIDVEVSGGTESTMHPILSVLIEVPCVHAGSGLLLPPKLPGVWGKSLSSTLLEPTTGHIRKDTVL